jgi:hypothetical protein
MVAEPSNNWVITQYLSMLAVLKRAEKVGMTELAKKHGHWWSTARQISHWRMLNAVGSERAWACGTLAELEMLGALYGGEQYSAEEAKKEIIRCCKEILETCGPQEFPVQSTVRQFRRYVDIWKQNEWDDFARAALAALGDSNVSPPKERP